ncbi:MAG: RNA 2',3'-cyclic phosphodiesterase [Rhodobacter sp.]|nr:RNA 2',3'-cyclic phosphodiesterase [Rhodobacter sp.]
MALALPDPALDALEALQDELPVGRAMARGTLHLTLAFLGDQHTAALESIDDELRQLKGAAFDLNLNGVGVFGGRQPRALWVGADAGPELTGLREQTRRAARRAGIELARERFRPHVTIARFGQRLHGDEVARIGAFLERNGGFRVNPFEVDRVTLYQSTLHRDGAVHEVLAEYGLQGFYLPDE